MGRPKCFSRNDVLDKAIQLFWRKGFADTSLQELEKATGVNKSGLYSEFKDKEDLFAQSLKRYAATNGALELLSREPLGRKNIEDFLSASQNCTGQKGCLFANTFREVGILPAAIKNQLVEHTKSVRNALLKNIEASGIKDGAETTADLLLTFNAGNALRLNMGENKGLGEQVRLFLDKILKK